MNTIDLFLLNRILFAYLTLSVNNKTLKLPDFLQLFFLGETEPQSSINPES